MRIDESPGPTVRFAPTETKIDGLNTVERFGGDR
jgi:hypothetical protein